MSTYTYVNLPEGIWRLTHHDIVYKNDIYKCIYCYAYFEFSSAWAQWDNDDVENVMLRMGYLINFTGCTVLWCSRLQTEIYLSTTKAEYITLSQEMR